MPEPEPGDFVTVEYPDGTTWVDMTRLTNGWVMCCLCFEYKPRSELAPDPRLDGCVIDVCKPCAAREAEAVTRRADEEPTMPEPDTAPAAPGLRDALEAALYPTYGQQDRERTRALTDAVLAVRDQEMEALRGAVRTLMRAHRDCGRDGEQMDGAHPPIHRWRVEHVDGDQWVPASGLKTDRAEAVHLLNVGNKNRPLWADGTPVQRRLVRETTSYTVETALTPPADQDRGGQ